MTVDDWEANGNYLGVGEDVELPVFVRVFHTKDGRTQWALNYDRGVEGSF